MGRYWGIIEQRSVTDAVAEAHAVYSRFHDLYDALTWRLSRDPLPDEAVEIAPEFFLVKSEAWSYDGFCQISMVYMLDRDNQQIVIEELWVAAVAA